MAITKQDVLKLVKENDVSFVRLWFTDIVGQLKSFSITLNELEGALEQGMGFDGSSIKGYSRIDESDMVAMPDLNTFQLVPWRPKEKGVARMICDVKKPEGEPYDGDPRYALKKLLAEIKKDGYDFFVGPEAEFFYFADDQGTEILDTGGYFDLTTLDAASDLRRETIFMLEAMGIQVEYSHHEVAPSQHEIDLRYKEALLMADNLMTYRVVVKEVAQKFGIFASFMPKPLYGENGSGMHVHQSLFKNGKNAFFDPNDKYFLSSVAKSYIAGILKYAPEITLVLNQWVNSYKRIVPGFEAPCYLAWAKRNRSALVRVPQYQPGKEAATRIEVRSPDPACNPYLAFTAMLAAGMEGIKHNLSLVDPIEKDIFEMSDAERKELGIGSLPGSLIEAIEVSEGSELLKKTFGEHIFNNLIDTKKKEWDEYRSQVHQWELDKYLSIL